MALDTAVVETPLTTDAPAAAPATGTPASAGGGGDGGSSQPTTAAPATAPAEGGKPTPVENHVPWSRFREAQTNATRYRRQIAETETKYQQQIAAIQKDQEQLGRYRTDYQAMEELLREHPDLAEQLYERAQGKGASGKRPPQTMAVSPEVNKALQAVERMERRMADFDRQRAVAEEQASDQQLSQALDQRIVGLMSERNISKEFAPFVRAYVLDKARQHDDLQLEDVPFLFGDFFRAFEGEMQRRLNGSVEGRRADLAGTPPAGGTVPGGPMTPKPDFSANPAKVLEQMLSERMGWNNGG